MEMERTDTRKIGAPPKFLCKANSGMSKATQNPNDIL